MKSYVDRFTGVQCKAITESFQNRTLAGATWLTRTRYIVLRNMVLLPCFLRELPPALLLRAAPPLHLTPRTCTRVHCTVLASGQLCRCHAIFCLVGFLNRAPDTAAYGGMNVTKRKRTHVEHRPRLPAPTLEGLVRRQAHIKHRIRELQSPYFKPHSRQV